MLEAVVFFLALVLVLVLLVVLAVVLVFWLVFFLRSLLLTGCAFWAEDDRACWEACDKGVNDIDVKSKAQSVIEILFIRATEQSPVIKAGLPSCLRMIFQNASILMHKNTKC
ncbi:hypothetical protein FHR25_004023 [Yokenella regensburgei]|nr:hypothetical protein HMPREF0880_03664 [Yokenella regensburgei ATCC 43003]KAF1367597.1 hypothetical protein FHR25_004023 [Yokenella regensburgei]